MKLKILLDPGHGPGKSHNRGSLIGNEGDNNFLLSRELKKRLEQYDGVGVGSTRPNGSENPTLTKRRDMSEGYDVFLSLHTNASESHKAHGSEIFKSVEKQHDNADNHKLAKLINDNVAKYFNSNRGVKTWTYSPKHLDLNYFAVMRRNKAPYVYLGEFGFHDNKDDIKVIINKRDEIAEAITQGFVKHFNLKKKTIKTSEKKMMLRVVVATFEDRQNALDLQKKLREKGFNSFLVPYKGE